MGAFSLGAEQGEQFRGLVASAADPVWDPGVELRRLPGAGLNVLLAKHESDMSVEDRRWMRGSPVSGA